MSAVKPRRRLSKRERDALLARAEGRTPVECEHGNARGFCADCEAARLQAGSSANKLKFRRMALELQPWLSSLEPLMKRPADDRGITDPLALAAMVAQQSLRHLIKELEEFGKP